MKLFVTALLLLATILVVEAIWPRTDSRPPLIPCFRCWGQ